MRKNRTLRTLLLVVMAMALTAMFTACGNTLRSGDLVFVCADTTGMDAAISDATANDNTVNYSHVGIIEESDGLLYVIDASPKYGVSRWMLRQFCFENGTCHFYRLKGYNNEDEWVAKAKNCIGLPYDFYFLPDNGKYYCSELVADVCVDADGNPIFKAQPMNFRAADGTIPDYWVNLFDSLGVEVPQGVMGTNPNDLVRSGKLQRIDLGDRKEEIGMRK